MAPAHASPRYVWWSAFDSWTRRGAPRRRGRPPRPLRERARGPAPERLAHGVEAPRRRHAARRPPPSRCSARRSGGSSRRSSRAARPRWTRRCRAPAARTRARRSARAPAPARGRRSGVSSARRISSSTTCRSRSTSTGSNAACCAASARMSSAVSRRPAGRTTWKYVQSCEVAAFISPPSPEIVSSITPGPRVGVPLKRRCSMKCDSPASSGPSSRAPGADPELDRRDLGRVVGLEHRREPVREPDPLRPGLIGRPPALARSDVGRRRTACGLACGGRGVIAARPSARRGARPGSEGGGGTRPGRPRVRSGWRAGSRARPGPAPRRSASRPGPCRPTSGASSGASAITDSTWRLGMTRRWTGAFGIDVLEGEDLVVLVLDGRGIPAGDDLAEDAVGHERGRRLSGGGPSRPAGAPGTRGPAPGRTARSGLPRGGS